MSLTLFVAPNGNDLNAGTIDQPFATVQAALSTLPVGQGGTVFLRGGSYQLTSPIRVSDNEGGTSTTPLSIRNYQDEKVLLDGQRLGRQNLDSIVLTSTRFVEIQGLEIQGSSVGIAVLGDARDITIRNNVVHDIQRAGIAAYAANQKSIQNITIDNNIVYRTNLFNQDRPAIQPGGWGSGIVFSRTEGGRISNNVVYQNYGEGIAITLSNGALAENNTVFDNYSVQLYLDHATNSTIDSNWIFNTGDQEFYRRFIQTDGSTVERAGKGILFANETYADANPLSNNLVRNNVVVGGDVALGYGNFDQGGGLKNTLVANNTFYANSTTRNIVEIAPDRHANTNIINNIFYAETPAQIVFLPDSLSGLNFGSNLWFGTNPNQAASPTDIRSNPQFVNPGGFDVRDYDIAANSSAIDRGQSLSQVSNDFLGKPRPNNGIYDLGAYEFGPATTGLSFEPSGTETLGGAIGNAEIIRFDIPMFDVPVFDVPVFDVPMFEVPGLAEPEFPTTEVPTIAVPTIAVPMPEVSVVEMPMFGEATFEEATFEVRFAPDSPATAIAAIG
jgi:parallel beta-helix repeat protein